MTQNSDKGTPPAAHTLILGKYSRERDWLRRETVERQVKGAERTAKGDSKRGKELCTEALVFDISLAKGTSIPAKMK